MNLDELNVGDLARQVDLDEPTVSHHLARLRSVQLVSLRMAGNQRFYRLNHSGLDRFKQLAAQIEQEPPQPEAPADDSWIEALDWSEPEKQVLRKYTSGGKITAPPPLPNKEADFTVLLRWLATLFEPDRL